MLESRLWGALGPFVAILTLVLGGASLPGCSAPPYHTSNVTPEWLTHSLKPQHPRILLTEDGLAQLKRAITSAGPTRDLYSKLEKQADALLEEPPYHAKENVEANLEEVRRSLKIITTFSGLYLLDRDPRKLARAKKELLVVVAQSDWDPKHFLDVAEMSFAVAIGYDWLYSELSDHEREAIEAGLIRLGLHAGIAQYRQDARWVKKRVNNWNLVCNAGLAVAALAVADRVPELSAEILDRAYQSIQTSMARYAPDGGCAEGPMYWAYGTRYGAFLMASLQSALGSDLGLANAPGFSNTGVFKMQMFDSLGTPFNFSDSEDDFESESAVFWLARRFGQPALIAQERRLFGLGSNIFQLLWSVGQAEATPAEYPELNAHFQAIDVAVFRSDWIDRRALYVGFKGGNNQESHAHLDLGSFVLTLDGARWAVDLGPDDYDLPGYFDFKRERWTYYRLRTESHNVWTINGENQDPQARAPMVRFVDEPARKLAVVDLSQAYPSQTRSSYRGISILEGKRVLIQDEIDLKSPAALRWNFMTRSEIKLQASEAILHQKSSRIRLRILSPKNARFNIESAAAPAPQMRQPDVHALRIHFEAPQGKTRISVLVEPADSIRKAPELSELKNW